MRKFEINEPPPRSNIRDKGSFLDAIRLVLSDLSDFRPVSVRQIHYALLNDPPLRNDRGSGRLYRNDSRSYKDLDNLLTRARVFGEIPMGWILDETRPSKAWDVYSGTDSFIETKSKGFLVDYCRDLMQSQKDHIEIIGEKNTIIQTIEPVAAHYCIPYTITRGYSSLPPRWNLIERFMESGKDRLILIFLSDFDPDGEMIVQSFVNYLWTDFAVKADVWKAALNPDQIKRLRLPINFDAKETSVNYEKFKKRHGRGVYELEAVKPNILQAFLKEAIESIIDTKLFEKEIRKEKSDKSRIKKQRKIMLGRSE